MTQHARRAALLAWMAVALTIAACGKSSPSAPSTSTTTTSSAPSVTAVSVSGSTSTTIGQTVQLTARATLSDGSSQDVTQQATWESSNTNIATVSASGLVSFSTSGDVDIKATYRSISGSMRITASPAQKPKHRLSGVLTDEINGRGVDGARVDIVNGVNAGRSATTPADGTYAFADLTEDNFTVRFTSAFYETAERGVTLTADTRVDVVMKPLTDVSGFYGVFTVNLSVNQQNCEFPFTPGPTGRLTLSGNKDGSNFTALIDERDNKRNYTGGRMAADGSWSGNGGGVIVGISRLLDRASIIYPHEYVGSMSGRVSGRNVTGVENVNFTIPCPGKTMQIAFSGAK